MAQSPTVSTSAVYLRYPNATNYLPLGAARRTHRGRSRQRKKSEGTTTDDFNFGRFVVTARCNLWLSSSYRHLAELCSRSETYDRDGLLAFIVSEELATVPADGRGPTSDDCYLTDRLRTHDNPRERVWRQEIDRYRTMPGLEDVYERDCVRYPEQEGLITCHYPELTVLSPHSTVLLHARDRVVIDWWSPRMWCPRLHPALILFRVFLGPLHSDLVHVLAHFVWRGSLTVCLCRHNLLGQFLPMSGRGDCALVVGMANIPHSEPRIQAVGHRYSALGVATSPILDLATASQEVCVHTDYRYAGNESDREDAGQVDIDATRRGGFYNLTLLVMARYVAANCPRSFRRYWGLPSEFRFSGDVSVASVLLDGYRTGSGFMALYYMVQTHFLSILGHPPRFVDSEQLENATEKVCRAILTYYGEHGDGRWHPGGPYILTEYLLAMGRAGEGGGLVVVCSRHVPVILAAFQEYALKGVAKHGIPIVYSEVSRYYRTDPRDSEAPEVPPFLVEGTFGRLRSHLDETEEEDSDDGLGGMYFLPARANRRRWRSATYGRRHRVTLTATRGRWSAARGRYRRW